MNASKPPKNSKASPLRQREGRKKDNTNSAMPILRSVLGLKIARACFDSSIKP